MIYHGFSVKSNNLKNVSAEQKDSSQKSDAHFWIHIYIFQYLEGKKDNKNYQFFNTILLNLLESKFFPIRDL